MKDIEIIDQLKIFLNQLEESKTLIEKNQWNDVTSLFSKINHQHDAIRTEDPSIKNRCEENPSFKSEYESLKEILETKVKEIIQAIDTWKSTQVEKISGAKNVMQNISNYYQTPNKSYYFDRKE